MQIKLDCAIQEIKQKLWKKYSMRESEIMLDPLIWYISSGRASTDFLARIIASTSREKATIANRLAKNWGWHDDAINSICQYLGIWRN